MMKTYIWLHKNTNKDNIDRILTSNDQNIYNLFG